LLLVAQTKEAGAVPFSPGYGLRDFRQAAVSPPLPNKALVEHRDPVMLAASLAGQHRAGRQVAPPPLESLRQRNGCLSGWHQIDVFEKADRGSIKVADRLGLQTIGNHRKQ